MALSKKPKPSELPDFELEDDMPVDIDDADQLDEVQQYVEEEVKATSDSRKMVVPEEVDELAQESHKLRSLNQALDDLEAKGDPTKLPTDFVPRNKSEELLRIRAKVDEVKSLINFGDVTDSGMRALREAIERKLPAEFDEDFDMRNELQMQMQLVKSVRSHILNEEGSIKSTASVSEVKSVIDASMKLADALNKLNKDLINQERIQAIEASFMQIAQETMTEEDQKRMLELLERKLKAQAVLHKK